MQLGKRLASLVVSVIRSMSRACEAVSGLNLGQGVCDLPTPPPIARGACDAIAENKVRYTAPEGLAPLRAGIAAKIRRFYGLDYDPESEVLVTSGATGGFSSACLARFVPGGELILFEPSHGYHLSTVIAPGLSPVLVPLRPPG
jgi:aminotransferase